MGNDIDAYLGKRLRKRRRLLGLSQKALGAHVGVLLQQIQKYECGANRISAARLWSLSQALAVPVGYFYEGLPTQDPISFGPKNVGQFLAAGQSGFGSELIGA